MKFILFKPQGVVKANLLDLLFFLDLAVPKVKKFITIMIFYE